MPPWTDCNDALALGTNGDACEGTFACRTPDRECCHTLASCSGGKLTIDVQCEPCPCVVDTDCGTGAWCTNGVCGPCALPPTCRPPFGFIDRNDCFYCVPPTRCRRDSECPAGEHCYAGQTCLPGCQPGDVTCCFGNGCAPPGCGPTTGLDCSLVGCVDGAYCHVEDFAQGCDCVQDRWLCTANSPNFCRAF